MIQAGGNGEWESREIELLVSQLGETQPDVNPNETYVERKLRLEKEIQKQMDVERRARELREEHEREIKELAKEEYAAKVEKIAQALAKSEVKIEDIAAFMKHMKRPAVWPSEKGSEAAPSTGAKRRGKAKYVNPANPSQTWTGGGRRVPEWIKPYQLSPEGVKPRVFKDDVKIDNRPLA